MTLQHNRYFMRHIAPDTAAYCIANYRFPISCAFKVEEMSELDDGSILGGRCVYLFNATEDIYSDTTRWVALSPGRDCDGQVTGSFNRVLVFDGRDDPDRIQSEIEDCFISPNTNPEYVSLVTFKVENYK